jgi:hypothetical protein
MGTKMIALEEVATTVNLIDNEADEAQILAAIDQLIEAFQAGVEEIFGLRRYEYRYYWLVANTDGFDAVSTDAPWDENDTHAIKSALNHPRRKRERFFVIDVPPGEYGEDYQVRKIVFGRNEGKFRLAFVVFVYKDGAVTDETLNRFRDASAMLMLLGHVDKLPRLMLEWIQSKHGGGATC